MSDRKDNEFERKKMSQRMQVITLAEERHKI